MTSGQQEVKSAAFRALVSSADRFLETCDGGDIGSFDSPSIWLMGVEPGWSLKDQLREKKGAAASQDHDESYSVDLQLGWPFNRTAFKLLSAIEGGAPEDYVDFAKRARPFERGSQGYFKANLFSVPFHNLEAWDDEAKQDTGFDTKSAYQDWVRTVRFPVVSSHLELHRPKLLIATGLAHLQDFRHVVNASTLIEHSFTVNGHTKRMFVSTDGLVPLVVVPHLSGGPAGLNSNAAVAQAAQVILKSTL